MAGRWVTLIAALALASCSKTAMPLRITGSSTVYPFSKAVADALVQKQPGRAQPMIESTGTGPGLQAFCASADAATPDIADASRSITRAEFDECAAKQVGPIMEVRIGLDGIVLAQADSGPALPLTRKDLYLALAANPAGKPNTAKTWKDVDPRLPAVAIEVLGPAPTSGTRAEFIERLMEPGCFDAAPEAKGMMAKGDKAGLDTLCHAIRTDGPFVSAGEDYAATAAKLWSDPHRVGVFGYSYLKANAGKLRGLAIDGKAPDDDTIASGSYPGARTLFLYVKKRQLKSKPDLQAYLDLYATMWAPGGPLAQKGLIPMSPSARDAATAVIRTGEAIDRDTRF